MGGKITATNLALELAREWKMERLLRPAKRSQVSKQKNIVVKAAK